MPGRKSDYGYWGTWPFYNQDGTRWRHRINYDRIPIPSFRYVECDATYHQCDHWDPAIRLAARKRMWRRIRTGYYDRRDPPEPVRWDDKGNKIVPPPVHVRCHARCRDGHPCKSMSVTNKYTGKVSTRCRMHGGFSTGPRTEAGKAAALAALVMGRNRSL